MLFFARFIAALLLISAVTLPQSVFADDKINIPILCYHNFNPTIPGSMNMRPEKFESHLKWLKDNGFTVIPLTEAVEYLQGTRQSLPPKSVVISADDGWQSVYTYMVPLIRKYNVPVTLFIYPQTISSGKNAMTWNELIELEKTGLFNVQSHTYSHPNFKQAKKHMSPAAYEQYVKKELVNSKKILEEKLNHKITLLAWPFGIYDPYLEKEAENAGYTMAFTIDARSANRSFRPEAQPRFMMIEAQSMKTFIADVNRATSKVP